MPGSGLIHSRPPDPASPPVDEFPYSGMISFCIRFPASASQLQTANTFLTFLRLFTFAKSLGGVEFLVECPAQMARGLIPPAERALLGIGDDLIRLSAGVEEDLVRDVLGALEKAVGGA
ncbi:Cys/Met metabolism PLP-dependent enzyme-domain-containing protein [Crucibulum laeve]|uniref:cystathionine gamma-lyase n=1 Tax=Crucibulum laeve TaxID=68775 RepID=A0A5C3LP76_9AGAR|nr:Cys/Met metabolism PLP-dependent enzyme-domain-containing protein [Crucibulum laeve]